MQESTDDRPGKKSTTVIFGAAGAATYHATAVAVAAEWSSVKSPRSMSGKARGTNIWTG
jgi:hypothetical protein